MGTTTDAILSVALLMIVRARAREHMNVFIVHINTNHKREIDYSKVIEPNYRRLSAL